MGEWGKPENKDQLSLVGAEVEAELGNIQKHQINLKCLDVITICSDNIVEKKK